MQATDNWIQFTVGYVVNHRKRRSTKDYLFRRILEEVDKTRNRVRLASATFELVSGSTLDVRLAPEQVNVLQKQAGAGVQDELEAEEMSPAQLAADSLLVQLRDSVRQAKLTKSSTTIDLRALTPICGRTTSRLSGNNPR